MLGLTYISCRLGLRRSHTLLSTSIMKWTPSAPVRRTYHTSLPKASLKQHGRLPMKFTQWVQVHNDGRGLVQKGVPDLMDQIVALPESQWQKFGELLEQFKERRDKRYVQTHVFLLQVQATSRTIDQNFLKRLLQSWERTLLTASISLYLFQTSAWCGRCKS